MSIGKKVALESARGWATEHRELARRSRLAYPHMEDRAWFDRLAAAHEAAATAFESLQYAESAAPVAVLPDPDR